MHSRGSRDSVQGNGDRDKKKADNKSANAKTGNRKKMSGPISSSKSPSSNTNAYRSRAAIQHNSNNPNASINTVDSIASTHQHTTSRPPRNLKTLSTRQAVYHAIQQSQNGTAFIIDTLEKWRVMHMPSSQDYQLAISIASVTVQRAMSLDYLIDLILGIGANKGSGGMINIKAKGSIPNQATENASTDNRPNFATQRIRPKVRIILRMALAQRMYMERIPSHAIVSESVNLAKIYAGGTLVANTVNAMLRVLIQDQLTPSDYLSMMPQGEDARSISIRYSFPIQFVEALSKQMGMEKTMETLEVSNTAPSLMARVRNAEAAQAEFLSEIFNEIETVSLGDSVRNDVLSVIKLRSPQHISRFIASPYVYIQNVTPPYLLALAIQQCTERSKVSSLKVLDMACSPGGKLFMLIDSLPTGSKFVANDISEKKLERIRSNAAKFGVLDRVEFISALGQDLRFEGDAQFDVVVVDTPCSNTGVLHRRAEARWRLESQDTLDDLFGTQVSLVLNACKVLNPASSCKQVWYMTCSILDTENHRVLEEAMRRWNMTCEPGSQVSLIFSKLVLPNRDGWDGGFLGILQLS